MGAKRSAFGLAKRCKLSWAQLGSNCAALYNYSMKRAVLGILVLLLAGAPNLACLGAPPPVTPLDGTDHLPNRTPLPSDVLAQMWRVDGTQIVDGAGKSQQMRGIAFGNDVWSHAAVPSAHHTGTDYGVVASMGMNVVRFYLTYETFEDDAAPFRYKETGWAWIDQNIEWAKQHKIRLILNLHHPQGGYQSLGKGGALWDDANNQKRFIELWRAIAERYRAEPTIAGYDLLNEPVPTSSMEQWKSLAEQTIAEIRQVDQHHMVFVERVNGVRGDWSENEERNFFKVSDPNVVYEFHFYKPYHFTHQGAEWAPLAAREGWYPDENIPEVDGFQLSTVATVESEALPVGDSDWTLLETKAFLVNDPKIVVGKPFLACDQGQGTASFDTLSLGRCPKAGACKAVEPPPALTPKKKKQTPAVEVVVEDTQLEMDLDTLRGWYFWKQNGEGQAYFDLHGHGDSTALSITDTTGPAHLGADPLRFFAKQGSEYTLRALAKGQSLGPNARCLIRLEFYASQVPVQARGKAYLEQEVAAYLAWGEKNQVPLFLGEFGTIRQSFLPGRGGLNWVSDMLDVLTSHRTHFTYHDYHETPFGLILGGDTLPNKYRLYLPLYELFVSKLGGSGNSPWGKPEEPSTATPAPEDEAPQESEEDDETDEDGGGQDVDEELDVEE